MPYSTITQVKDKVVERMMTQAAWLDADGTDRITEGDRTIDALLKAMGYAVPFATTPPMVETLSILYARYAIVRDIFLKGAPSKANASTEMGFKDQFERMIEALRKGEAVLIDALGNLLAQDSPQQQVSISTSSVDRIFTMGDPESSTIPDSYTDADVIGEDE